MNTQATPSASTAPSRGSRAGTVLCRLVVPGWILAGAAFKLWERNPQLLPKPVTDVTDFLFVKQLGISREAYLDPAMRAMVAVEIAAAILMVVAPVQAARLIGTLVLALFCTILGVLLASGAASCGCFGALGPSPGWMLAIDLSMLAGLLVLAPRGRRLAAADLVRRFLTVLPVPAALGFVVAFAVPQRANVALPQQPAEAPTARAWPAPPATAKPWYAPEFDTWKGQRLDAQELMLLVPRPLPADLNAGRHHVVFMREDCDHCHALLTQYFSATLETPTTTVAVPDATGELLENPCAQCTKATLPGGITYVFSTPVLLTVQDGVVVGVCTDSENADLVRAALNAR